MVFVMRLRGIQIKSWIRCTDKDYTCLFPYIENDKIYNFKDLEDLKQQVRNEESNK